MPFSRLMPSHARELIGLFEGPQWRELRDRGELEAARNDLLTPPKTAGVFALPADQLKAVNGERVRAMIAAGERDEERLLAELGTWPETWPADVPVRLSFLGLSLSFACDMQPRCVYCNQRPTEQHLNMEHWKSLVRGLPATDGQGTYIYLTGGEPLVFGEELWGPDGLIRAATESGHACNVNTNALTLTPQAAVGMVRSGLGRVHISLDTHRPELQDALYQQVGAWRKVTQGLYNLQIAKAVLGAAHPVIHLNCVLTRHSARDFVDFFRFVLDRKPLVDDAVSGDLDMHLIPVGGEANASLRLSAEAYRRFFTDTWADVNEVWHEYQRLRNVPSDKRGHLHEKVPYMSPFHRVQQRGDLASWAECAGSGQPGDLALTKRCYVAPTQAFVLPDGSQYWCGGHAVARPEPPVGDVRARSVADNIRQSIAQVRQLPITQCRNCPGATQAINQGVEATLRRTIQDWINPTQEQPASEPQEDAFEGDLGV